MERSLISGVCHFRLTHRASGAVKSVATMLVKYLLKTNYATKLSTHCRMFTRTQILRKKAEQCYEGVVHANSVLMRAWLTENLAQMCDTKRVVIYWATSTRLKSTSLAMFCDVLISAYNQLCMTTTCDRFIVERRRHLCH
ncbi:hypothetical protein CBL_05646 [Carabus blaptoides fortunei]